MRPLHRATFAEGACHFSGQVVETSAAAEVGLCPVCGGRLSLRAKWQGSQWLARAPTHRRADLAQTVRAERKAGRVEYRAQSLASQAKRSSAKAQAAGRCGSAQAVSKVRRAVELVEALPEAPSQRRQLRSLQTTAARLAAQRDACQALSLPRDAARVVRVILNASDIDHGAVDPDNWLEFLGGFLPSGAVRRIAGLRQGQAIREGLVALVRQSKARSWLDLENAPFAGDYSVLEVARTFPGLEALRLPDEVFAAAANVAEEEIPF